MAMVIPLASMVEFNWLMKATAAPPATELALPWPASALVAQPGMYARPRKPRPDWAVLRVTTSAFWKEMSGLADVPGTGATLLGTTGRFALRRSLSSTENKLTVVGVKLPRPFAPEKLVTKPLNRLFAMVCVAENAAATVECMTIRAKWVVVNCHTTLHCTQLGITIGPPIRPASVRLVDCGGGGVVMLAMLCQGSVMLSIPTFKTVLLAVTGLYRRSLPRGAPAGAQGREYRSSDRAGFSSPMGGEVYGAGPCG